MQASQLGALAVMYSQKIRQILKPLKKMKMTIMAIILIKAAVHGTDLWNVKLGSQAGMCLGESQGLSVRSGTSNGQERTWF